MTAGEKPTRREALGVLSAGGPVLRPRCSGCTSRCREIVRDGEHFVVRSETPRGLVETPFDAVVVATGYFGNPNLLHVPGESLPHVTHLYREGHEAFRRDVVVVGGGNSAVDAALDLWRCGAKVTLVHFREHLDDNVKPWVLPDITNRFKDGSIAAQWRRAGHADRRRYGDCSRVQRPRSAPGEPRVSHDGLHARTPGCSSSWA